MGFIAWIVVGLIAGWLAGQVMKGGGYGVLVDIILGILGGVVGGWVFGLLGIWPGGGMDRCHHCRICGCGNFGRHYALAEKSLSKTLDKKNQSHALCSHQSSPPPLYFLLPSHSSTEKACRV